VAHILLDGVLVATDFSLASSVALHYAIVIAGHFGANLYLAHVIPQHAYGLIPTDEREPAIEKLRARVEEQLDGLRATSHLVGPPHEVLVDHGDVWPTLLAMAEKHKINMTVIGTHGPRGVEKLLEGSMGEQILLGAQHPVLMVGPACSAASAAEPRLGRILYATDFSQESEPAMHFACYLAKEFSATLFFLHVVEDIWDEPLSTGIQGADFIRLRLLEKHWVIEEGCTPELHVEFGQPSECILEVAEELQIQLIVLGVRGTRYPRVAAHLPGPTAYDVASHSRCPVLVVRGGLRAEK
jgi:nucleotide-binding universal stress UspA family protein